MRLIEALEILGRPAGESEAPLTVSLVTGFEPLHLRTFLTAMLRQATAPAAVEVSTGIFDDLPGGLARATEQPVDAIAVVVEWSDIDPRLGLRRLGGWRPSDVADIVARAELSLDRLERELVGAARSAPVVCCPPTLPMPALFGPPPERAGAPELQIRGAMAGFVARLARQHRIRICGLQALEERSPPRDRRDVRAELSAGFPYSLGHAAAVAELLSRSIAPQTPKKGLITDLDETMWAGVAGEVGPENVSWSIDSGAGRHAIYQQLLASLASTGVLLAAASRNDPDVVTAVFERPELGLPQEFVFPFEVGWGPKPESIARILEAWNIGAGDAVFVDDSAIELDQARMRFPDLVTVRFPGEDSGLLELLTRLRGLFGKDTETVEDRLRLASVRAAGEVRRAREAADFDPDAFLAGTMGALEFSRDGAHRARALELIDKTNQFNLNGRRVSESALEGTQLVTASYTDRYGPLGVIVALLVRPRTETLTIEHWVISCRALSRRIEHHCLQYLFDAFGVDQLTLEYVATERNQPLRECLRALLDHDPDGAVVLTREVFDERAPTLVHRVSERAA